MENPFNMEERGENRVDFFFLPKDMRKLVIVILENNRSPFKSGFLNSKIKLKFPLHGIQQGS